MNFLTGLGDLGSGGAPVTTDASGVATDLVVVPEEHIAPYPGEDFEVRAQTVGAGGVLLEAVSTVWIAGSAPVAVFTFSGAPGSFTVSFTFTGTGEEPLRFAWDFEFVGGFVVDSTLRNPTFTYATPGAKTVKLRVENQFGAAAASATITIPNP